MNDRVSLTSENHPNYMIAMCGTFFNGITFAPLNPAYTESKVKTIVLIYNFPSNYSLWIGCISYVNFVDKRSIKLGFNLYNFSLQ